MPPGSMHGWRSMGNDSLNPVRLWVEYEEARPAYMYDKARALMSKTHRVLSIGLLPEAYGPRRRFLVPALMQFGQVGLFFDDRATIDCELEQLFRQIRKDPHRAVYVAESDLYAPWPAFMIFRGKYCTALTLPYVTYEKDEAMAPVVWAGGRMNVGTVSGVRVAEGAACGTSIGVPTNM